MARLWACLVVLLCASATHVAAQCNCKTVPQCPEVFSGGKVTPCIMPNNKGIGLCCPSKSAGATSPAAAAPPAPPAPPASPTPPVTTTAAPSPPTTPATPDPTPPVAAPPAAPTSPQPPAAADVPPSLPKPPPGVPPQFLRPFPGFPFFPPGGFPPLPKASGLPPVAASQISLSRTASQPNQIIKSDPNSLAGRSIPPNLNSGGLALPGAKPGPVPSSPPLPSVKPPVPAASKSTTPQKPPLLDFLKFLQLRGLKPPPGLNFGAKPGAPGASLQNAAKPEAAKQAQPTPVAPTQEPATSASPMPAELSPTSTPASPSGAPGNAAGSGPEPGANATPGNKEVKTPAGLSPGGPSSPKFQPGIFPPPKPGFLPFGPFKPPPGGLPPPGFQLPPGFKGQFNPFALPPKFQFPFPKPPGFALKTPGAPGAPGATPKASGAPSQTVDPAAGTLAAVDPTPTTDPTATATTSEPPTSPGGPAGSTGGQTVGVSGAPSPIGSQSGAPGMPGFPGFQGIPGRKLITAGVQVSPQGGIINPGANILGKPTSGLGAAPAGAPAASGSGQLGSQLGAQSGSQPGAQSGGQSGSQQGIQPGGQSGAQPGAQAGAQPGTQYSPSGASGSAAAPGPLGPIPGQPPQGGFQISPQALGRTPSAAAPPAGPEAVITAGQPGAPPGGFAINPNALGRTPAAGSPSGPGVAPVAGYPGGASAPGGQGGFRIGGNTLVRPTTPATPAYVPGQFNRPAAAARPGLCVPLVLCPPVVAKQDLLYSNWCRLRDGSLGFSCSFDGTKLPGVSTGLSIRSTVGTGPGSPLANMRPMNIYTTGSRDFRKATPEAEQYLNDASLAAEEYVNQQQITAQNLRSTNQVPLLSSPTTLFFWNAQATIDAADIGLLALHSLNTVQNLEILAPGTVNAIKSIGPDGPAAAAEAAVAALYAGTSPEPTPDQLPLIVPDCEPAQEIFCEPSNYRSINGQCNNIKRPHLGSAMTGHKRVISDAYDDGIFSMRSKTIRGGQLPSARIVSERVLDTLSNELRDWTLSLMQFGQFVANDMTKTHVFRLSETEGVECCLNSGFVFPAPAVHPQCISIPIKITDPFYGQFGQRCMGMTRSLPAPEPDCVARPAKPLNEHTSFLDASQIYGSDPKVTEELRSFNEGLMLTSEIGNLLPMTGPPGPEMPCRAGMCFLSGDTRINQHSGLVVMHTVWLREHNRIARYLFKRHPDWADEELFQETRRIVIAEWQHIIYHEYVPAILGFDYADAHGLLPFKKGFSNYYDEKIDPSNSVMFESAAMRFGHSMVRDMYDLLDANGQVFRVVNLTTTMFEPTVVSDGFVGHARTLVARRSEAVDTSVAKSIQEQLFTTNFQYGMDLIAINIQRGRDQGTPTYVQAAEACGVVQVHYWGDLHRVMESKTIDKLRSVYDDPRDVDLFVGGIAEKLAPGAQVGPTFQCLIGQQFFDARYGDRFFYDNGGLPHSMTEVQLAEIRKTSWARILCDALGPEYQSDFNKVQPLAFLTTLGRNQVLSCNTLAIPQGELSAF